MPRMANAALRLTSGALILNSGIDKLGMDEGTAGYLKNMAASGLPAVSKLDDKLFGKVLAGSEVALGATLLCPLVPAKLAGLGLTAFSASLLSMYFGKEGLTKDGIRPTQEGQQLANNIVLAGAGLALLFSSKKK